MRHSTSVFHGSDKKRSKVADQGCSNIKPSYMGWVRQYWPQMFTLLFTSFPHHSSEQLLGTDELLFFPTTASDKQVVMRSISMFHHPCERWGGFCQEQPCCLFLRCSYLLDAQKFPLCLCLPAWFPLAVKDFHSSSLFQLVLVLSIKADLLSLISLQHKIQRRNCGEKPLLRGKERSEWISNE